MEEVKNKEYREIFSKSKENWDWFRKNRGELLEEYSEQFVLISERKVIAYSSDLDRLLKIVSPEYREKEHLVKYLSKEGIELVL
ncbi:MAG: hypothetical protein JRI26_13065 [Deltaproteobacteria bacterium]|nr:hypothetical protein [Deltaproteobacteria bacterium]